MSAGTPVRALEDRVLGIVAASGAEGVRFAEVLMAIEDRQPGDIFSTLRRLVGDRVLACSDVGTMERPAVVRYRTRGRA